MIQEQSIHSLDISEIDLEEDKIKKESFEAESEASVDREIKEEPLVDEDDEGKPDVGRKPRVTIADENTFNKFLDIMEIF